MAKKMVEIEVEFPKVYIIEVDGESHELVARDDVQAAAFEKQGFKVKE
jgi:very-short-patch-repair endonuclease